MEIKIKTQEEIRNSRVVLELTGETNEVAEAMDRIRATGFAAAEAGATNYHRLIKGLEDDRDRLMVESEAKSARINALENRITNLGDNRSREVRQLKEQVSDLINERDRLISDFNVQEGIHAQERATANQSLRSRDFLLTQATTRVEKAIQLLARPEVTKTRDEIVTSKGAVLADAIRDALAALKPSTED